MSGNEQIDAAAASAGTTRPRILLVEDDAGVRRSTQLLLQARGYEVRAYADSVPLLVDAATYPAACLIIDYRLPGGDGIRLLPALRERGWSGPAILISAFSSDALARDAREAGFTIVFEKPLREHVLVDAVARLVQPSETAGE